MRRSFHGVFYSELLRIYRRKENDFLMSHQDGISKIYIIFIIKNGKECYIKFPMLRFFFQFARGAFAIPRLLFEMHSRGPQRIQRRWVLPFLIQFINKFQLPDPHWKPRTTPEFAKPGKFHGRGFRATKLQSASKMKS